MANDKIENFIDPKLVETLEKLILLVPKLAGELSKLMEAAKGVDSSLDGLTTSTEENEKKKKKLTEAEKESQRILKATDKVLAKKNALETEAAKNLAKQQQDLNKRNKALKDSIKLEKSEADSIDRLRASNAALRKERNAVNTATETGRKRIEALNKTIDSNDKKIKTNTDSYTKQKIEIGGYSAGIKGAISDTGVFATQQAQLSKIQNLILALTNKQTAAQNLQTTATIATSTATGVFSGALKVLKFALIATGIGAIVVVLGSLIAFFTQTQRGSDLVSKAMAGLGAAVSVVIDRFSTFGSGLVKLFKGDFKGATDAFKASIKGVGAEIAEESKAAAQLEEDFQKLQDREIAFIKTKAELKRSIAEARLATKNENLTTQERLDLLDEAIAKEKELAAGEVELARERARISQEQTDLGESSRDEIRENAKVQVEAAEVEEAVLIRLRKISSERLSFLNKLNAEEKKTQDEKTKETARTAKEEAALELQITKDLNDDLEKESLDSEKFILDAQKQFQKEGVKAVEDASKKKIEAEKQAADTRKQLESDLQDAKIDLGRQAIDALFELADQQAEAKIERNEEEREADIERVEMEAEEDFARIDENLARGIITEEQAAAERAAVDTALAIEKDKINEAAAKREAELKTKQARADKARALVQIQIDTALSIGKTAATLGFPAAIPFIAIAAASGAIQSALILAQKIPQFFKGTDSAPGGVISAGEKGSELIIPKSGQPFITPDKPTLYSGLKGAQIIPNDQTMMLMAGMGQPGTTMDTLKIERGLGRVESAIKKQSNFSNNRDGSLREQKGNYRKNYRDIHYS